MIISVDADSRDTGEAEHRVLAGPSQLVRGAYVASVEAALGTAGRLARTWSNPSGGVLIPFEVEHQLKCCADH